MSTASCSSVCEERVLKEWERVSKAATTAGCRQKHIMALKYSSALLIIF